MKKYIKWIGMFALLLIPCISSAALISWDTLQSMTFTPPVTDISVAFLGKLFGSVPGVPQLAFATPTIFGPIFAVFNAGLLGISGVFLGYTVFKIVTETTMDGASLGKSTTIWTTARVALSTTLLIPQASGYSVINGIVMWIVIQSIGLADFTWNNALEYLKRGVPIESTAPVAWVDYSLINQDVKSGASDVDDTNKSFNVGSADVLRSLICSYTIKEALIQKQKRDNNIDSQNIRGFSIYKATEAKGEPAGGEFFSRYSGGIYQFPFVEGEGKDSSGYLLPFAKDNINIAAANAPFITGICGTISYVLPKSPGTSNKDYTEFSAIYLPAKKSGLQQMIDILDPVARQLVNQAKPNAEGRRTLDPDSYIVVKKNGKPIKFSSSEEDTKKYLPENLQYHIFYKDGEQQDEPSNDATKINWPQGTSEILSAAAAYQVSLANTRSEQAAGKIDKDMANTYKEAKDKGWIMAGSYYNLLLQASNLSTIDFTLYRLIGYRPDGTQPLTEIDANLQRGNTPTASPFFSFKVGNLKGLLSEIDGPNNETSAQTLDRTLSWVYFTYPYSKIYGKTIVSSAAATSGFTQKVHRKASLLTKTTDPTKIRLKLYTGALLLTSPLLATGGILLVVGVPMEFLWHDINSIMNKWNELMGGTSKAKDPIVKLKLLGEKLINGSIDYLDQMKEFFLATSLNYAVSAGIQTAISAILGLGSFWGTTTGAVITLQTAFQAVTGINEMARTIIYMYLPIGLAVVGPLFVTGITLSIYIPLVPYMLFLFGALSWFISVIVLMAGAPIICFLMLWTAASQQNLLLTIEAEHFVKQMIAVFFRPTLMVIGLIVGVALARIGVDILNAGFSVVTENILLGSEGNVKMIKEIGIIVIYTFTMVALVNLCFSTIHLLYSEVMRIASIQVAAGGMEEKYMGEVKAESAQIAQAGVGGAKESAAALRGTGRIPEPKAAPKAEPKTTVTGKGEAQKK